MSRLTRCPACATVFRVSDAQLESRQGFVRCGQCAKVFDARASLADDREAPRSRAEDAASASAAEGFDAAVVLDGPASVAATMPEPPPVVFAPANGAPVDSSAPEVSETPRVGASAALRDAADEPATEPLLFGPGHHARSRTANILWGLAGLLLLAALAAQAAYWFRAELVTALPESRPYLEAACRKLDCKVPPPRQTTLLSIESSELQVDKNVPGLLTLNATLRNRATFAQAHPSIELTLTDADDRPLSRRVLGPAEYLGERLAREPLFPAVSEYSVRLHIDATAFKPTGYRLFLFHP